MSPLTSALISSVLTAFMVVAAVNYLQINNSSVSSNDWSEEYALLIERMDHTDELLLNIKNDIATVQQRAVSQLTPNDSIESIENRMNNENMAIRQNESIKQVPATDEEVTNNIITQLHDSTYAYGNTTSEFLASDEMMQLSDTSRERVIAEVVRMLNSGEIDADTFIKNNAQ